MSRFTICTAEQRSPGWFSARLGRVTGSKATAVLARGKGNDEAVTHRDYRVRLAVEQITGVYDDDDDFQSKDMRRGVEHELDGIAAYECLTGEVTRRTGFLSMTDCLAGCSLDFDVNDLEGFGELKCPKAAIHLQYIEEKRVPPAYDKQILHNLWVSGAKWCDFVSYNATVPESLRLFVYRIQRNEIAIVEYEKSVKRFLAEVALTVKKIRQLKVAA